jgi:hypothetical protein
MEAVPRFQKQTKRAKSVSATSGRACRAKTFEEGDFDMG